VTSAAPGVTDTVRRAREGDERACETLYREHVGRVYALCLRLARNPAAVDLGCAYTLEVDSAGNSFIHVTLGWVSWESEGREALVPAGNRAQTREGRGTGTPYADEAPPALRRALLAYDFEQGGDSALVEVLRVARARDGITLWHLLSRVESGRRVAVYQRLAELVPPPEGVTRDAVLRLDQMALKLWWERLPGSLPIIPSWSRTIWLWWLKLVG
jgi:hypothetical protein